MRTGNGRPRDSCPGCSSAGFARTRYALPHVRRLTMERLEDRRVLSAGPRITGQLPEEVQSDGTPLSAIALTFDEAVDPASYFEAGAVLKDPQGFHQVAPMAVSPVADRGDAQFDLTFVEQDLRRRYRLTVGPNIADAAGNPMGQDGDNINGDSDDAYTGTIESASTVGSAPSPPDPLPLIVSTAVDESDGDYSPGDLSLREALVLARGQPGDDVVSFDAALTGRTITLAPALGELMIDSNVDIQGPGSEQLTVDAERHSRVVFVTEGATAAIRGLTVTGGLVYEANGGGIYNAGTITLSSCTIAENEVEGDDDDPSTGRGGGIYNAGTATLTDCLVRGNTSDEGPAGGGIYNLGELTVVGTTIAANHAVDGNGGGVFNAGTGVLLQTTIAENFARSGGGVSNAGILDISGATLSDNIADRYGGGIRNSGRATVADSEIVENQALIGDGGGIDNHGTLTVSNATISGNSVLGFGGGIHNADNLVVTGTTICENEASDGGGGGLHNSGTATLNAVTISGNRGKMSGGGGIWNRHTLTLTNSTVSGNSAANFDWPEIAQGGGIRSEGTATLINDTICENSAEEHGGVYSESGNTLLHNTIVARNFLVDESFLDAYNDDVTGLFDVASSCNLIGVINGSVNLAGIGTVYGTLDSPLDPRLGPLKDNGGPTFTHTIWPDSPGVDAGNTQRANDAGLTHDQRGFERFLDGDGDATVVVDVGAYELEFDQTPPAATLGLAPDVVCFGDTVQTFQVEYSDNFAVEVSSFGDSDVRVTGPGGYDEPARRLAVDMFADGSPRTVTYQVPSAGVAWDTSDNGTYEIMLRAGEVVDLGGNFATAAVLGSFAVAIDDQVPSPVPLHKQDPPGSLIYTRLVSGAVSPTARGTNQFTVDLDDGQTFAVVAHPDPTLQPTIELLDPRGASIGSAAAAAPGEDAVIQAIPISSAGTYTVTLAGVADGTGACTIRLVLNAAVEAEEHNGPDNDDPASAEDLDGSLIALGDAASRRGAVLGRAGSSEDWYRFTLEDGQSATLLLTGELLEVLSLELYDGRLDRLAVGKAARNVNQAINNFIDSTSDGNPDTYFARVSGPSAGDYSLLLTRDADFDTEQNGTAGTAQELAGTRVVLGHVGKPASADEGEIAAAASQSSGGVGSAKDLPSRAIARNAEYAPGRLIVRFADGVKDARRIEALATLGGNVVRELPMVDGAVVELADAKARPSAGQQSCPTDEMPAEAARWSAHPAVLYAEPDYLLHTLDTFPNDPDFSGLWGMHNTGQTGGTPDADIDAPEAWDVCTGSSTVVVASIDTGVDYTHEDLAANMWTNPGEIPGDGIDNDGNGYVDDFYGIDVVNHDSNPMDDQDHGTHTAGTIGAVGDNGIGVTGVNWDVRIMALKAFDIWGFGWTSDAVTCLQYMTTMKTAYGVNVVASNNSWGGGGYSQTLRDAIEASNDAGIMCVAAAGNASSNTDFSPHYPSSYDLDGIISVAASDHDDQLAEFSNYGATSVDLAAPGVDVLSCRRDNAYRAWSGTSMASPHVAGAVAMLMAQSPRATLQEVKTAILDGVDPLAQFADVTVSGGRLNLAGALAMLRDRADWYRVAAEAGNLLQIETGTPGDGPFQPLNRLDPAIELYDPAGTLVAADDNSAPDGRNAQLVHEAAVSGTYAVHVLAAGELDDSVEDSGEYVLNVAGHTAPLRPFEVAASDPAVCDLRANNDPVQVALDFDDSVLVSSLDPSDLTVNGVPATTVTAVQANTALFEFAGALSEGPNQVVMTAGAVVSLQGTPVEPYAGTLWGIGGQITVSTAVDEQDGVLDPGNLSLREALTISRELSGGHAIRFEEDLGGSTIVLDPVLKRMMIMADVDIQGLGPDQLTIDAAGHDGIFYVAADTTVSITGLTLTGGSSSSNGGAIYNSGNLTVTHANLYGNFATRHGSAIYNSDGAVTLEAVTISESTTGSWHSGTALFHSGRGTQAMLMIRDSTISDNHCAALRSVLATATLIGVTVSGNRGGVHFIHGTVILTHVTVSGNGIGIDHFGSTATLTNVTVSENADTGIESSYSNVVMNNVTVFGNRGDGGISNSLGSATLDNSTVYGNSSRSHGGGVANACASVTITNTAIYNNSSSADGGGLSNREGNVSLEKVAIYGNSADRSGGGMANENATVTVANTTISGNSTAHGGGGVFASYSSLRLVNTTVFDNSAREFPGLYFYDSAIILHNTIADDVFGELDPASSHNLIGGDPGLEPLADNGGPTLTHALLPGSPAVDGGSNDRAIETGLTRDQRGFYRFIDGDGEGTAVVDIGAYEFGSTLPGEVVGRYFFYNNSAFDGNDPAANPTDEHAIAPDPDAAVDPYLGKTALLPGGTASFQNYTSYLKGINGLAIDIAGLPASVLYATSDPDTSDFEFRSGNDDHPGSWRSSFDTVDPVPLPGSVTVAEDIEGPDTDRVKLIWDDYAIVGQWLEVRVLATERTGLEHDDVFYFGNAPGEAGDSDGHAMVNMTDEILCRSNPRSPRDPAPIDDPYDFNRDRLVDVTDRIIARQSRTGVSTALRLISPPQQEAGSGGGRLGSAVGHDAVLERATRQESSGETTSLGKLAWLADLDYEQLLHRGRSTHKERSDARAIDALLASPFPCV